MRTGKGWDVCQRFCHPGATFSAQTGALADVKTLQAYTDWMKGLFTPVPDARYEVKSFAVDESRKNVMGYGVFRGTHTGPGGPVPATWTDDKAALLVNCSPSVTRYLDTHTSRDQYRPYIISGQAIGEPSDIVLTSIDTCAAKAPNFGVPEQNVFK